MGNINFKNIIKRIRMTDNGNWNDGTSDNYVITQNVYKDGYLNPSLYPYTDFLLFPSVLSSYVIVFWDNDVNGRSSTTLDIGKNKVINGFALSTRKNYEDDFTENNHIFPLKYLNYSDTSSRVFNQKVYPTNFFSFTNTEDYVGLSVATLSLDLTNFDYNDGENWTTQTKVYILKITDTGINGEGKFVLRSFPYIINNNEYETLPAGAVSMYSESVHVYGNSESITFMNTKGGLKDDFTVVTGLWAESRRKDPTVYDDFVCLLLEDANTLNVYDFHSPFLPTKEKTITLANNTWLTTWCNGKIYTFEDSFNIAKIDFETETRTLVYTNGVPMYNIRYIRDYINGSSYKFFHYNYQWANDSTNIWTEIKAFGNNLNNLAFGKTVTGSVIANESYPYTNVVDETTSQGRTSTTGLQYVEVDLGENYRLDDISIYHYDSDYERIFNNTKTEISSNGINWTTVYDSSVDGTYTETPDGFNIGLKKLQPFLVTHPDQDYVYLIGKSAQQIIDVSDDSVTTTAHDLTGYALLPTFDEDGNVWIGKHKFAKATLSLLYTHTTEAICNYNFIIDDNDEYFDLNGNSLNSDARVETLGITPYSTLTGIIKRYPQSYLLPYNTTDITQMFNQNVWIDSTGSEYDGSTNKYEIPANGEVTITDGIKVIVDDNDGYNQVVEDDYFYFVVSGRGLVLDNWSSASIKMVLNAWDYTEYTKNIVLSDATYTIEEAGLSTFIELNTLVVSGNWNDSSEIIFTTSTPAEGEIQLNSNGTMTFNTNDIGRTATITYNVGTGV